MEAATEEMMEAATEEMMEAAMGLEVGKVEGLYW